MILPFPLSAGSLFKHLDKLTLRIAATMSLLDGFFGPLAFGFPDPVIELRLDDLLFRFFPPFKLLSNEAASDFLEDEDDLRVDFFEDEFLDALDLDLEARLFDLELLFLLDFLFADRDFRLDRVAGSDLFSTLSVLGFGMLIGLLSLGKSTI